MSQPTLHLRWLSRPNVGIAHAFDGTRGDASACGLLVQAGLEWGPAPYETRRCAQCKRALERAAKAERKRHREGRS